MPTWHKIPKLHLTGTVIICRTGFSSKAYRAQSPSLLSFIDANKHCEHPSTQTVHWADSAHVSKAPPGWDISDNPKSSKAPEQRCAMDSSDTWIREQLRQIRTSQCCVSEITQLPLSLPQWRELKPWKQQSHRSKMLSLPVTATPACQQDEWPKHSPIPYGWAAWGTWAVRLDLAQGSSVLRHTNLYIRGYLLFACVSDLCTDANCSLCLGKLTLGVLLLTLTSTDLVWLNRQEFQTSLKHSSAKPIS